ncbi:tetratricopeptide repeat protein [Rhodoferax sp.]|uniref:tetratricopeptide repeat protein n=1 Tax=Rhodoferax sp. TaxID=50421 RepID=UPI0025D8209E|nr:tetratricopeptide repeat protein [Rhodoferax sp.]
MTSWLKKLFGTGPAPVVPVAAPAAAAPTPPTVDASTAQRQQGNRFLDQGNLSAAVACYRQAVALDPASADAHTSLGFALQQLGQLAAAQTALTQALALQPGNFDAAYLLGQVHNSLQQPERAMAYFEQALALQPAFEPLYGELCQALIQAGALDAARKLLVEGLRRFPQNAMLHFFLGNLHTLAQEWAAAIASYSTAQALNPALTEASEGLAAAHRRLGYADLQSENYAASEQHSRQALALRPQDAPAQNNLGSALAAQDRLQEAETAFRAALALAPQTALFHSNLGGNLVLQGRLEEAVTSLRQAIALDDSGNPGGFSNLLFALNYHPDLAAEAIFEDYKAFEQQFGAPRRADWQPHPNDRNPARRLKVGYVSPDFKNHAARFFIEPLLAWHDRSVVEIYAYAELAQEDSLTQRYKSCAAHWVPTRGLSDAELAQRIRADGIDVLVDMAGHTAGNRLGVFARKPAPVSLSWMGYGTTTGLRAIDYYLTDATSAPQGSEHLFSEEPWRLPGSFVSYRPGAAMGEVNVLPALERGYVTLGTLTRSIRINHHTVRVWAQILQRLPTARLVVDSRSFEDAAVKNTLAQQFAALGIAPERLQMGFTSPPWDVLRGIDIGLDCFPHNSGTTLFETLYMGIPFVTLAGRPSVGRLGSAILQGAGHPEWITQSEAEYMEKVVALASDLPALAQIRATLRAHMQASPLMDEEGFAKTVEQAYQAMFARWLEKTGMLFN